MNAIAKLPASVVVLERGWLSSNSVVVLGRREAALIDSGYWTHAQQTTALVSQVCGALPLTKLVNTHLHSDHCGGNAALQAAFPALRTCIPPGLAASVRAWDPVALTYEPTGQHCPQFAFDALAVPGTVIRLGDLDWDVLAAPGHDPDSIVLFERGSRTLVSADALWENGFGVVFPELEGTHAFDDVSATLDLIEQLDAAVVVPGHGAVFDDAAGALARARKRLAEYRSAPERHAAHAAKVLLKFKLLEWQRIRLPALLAWSREVGYLQLVHHRWFDRLEFGDWICGLVASLERSGALRRQDGDVINT